MLKEQVEVTIPFNAKRKVYPNGQIDLKHYKFTSYRIEEGYERNENHTDIEKQLEKTNISKHKDTYSSFVQDWKDKKILRELDLRNAVAKETNDEKIPYLSIVYVPEVGNERAIAEYAEQRRKRKIVYNIAKTRDKIFDIAISNDWNYFITLTYSSDKCDRYSFIECSKKVRQYMNNFRKEHLNDCPNFKYLIIPEKHKDGAYHFHGLIYLEDSGTLVLAEHQPKKCNYPVYNWGRWKYGFSTVTKIDNIDATRKYILKYVGKNIEEDYVKGQKRFFYSQNCLKPEISRFLITEDFLIELYEEVYDTDISTGYKSTLEDVKTSIDLIANLRYGI